MSDLDTRLDEALKADAAAPRGPMFRIQVTLARERRAFRRQLLIVGVVGLATVLLSALAAASAAQAVQPGPWRLTVVGSIASILPLAVAGVGLRKLGLLGGIIEPMRARTASVLRPLLWH